MAKNTDDVEESGSQSETESSEDVASDDSDDNAMDISSSTHIKDSTFPLADFRLSCLHDIGAEDLSSALQKYQQICKGLDKDVVPQRSITTSISADFTPWWEGFTKSDHKSVITSVTEPNTDGDTYDNWFDKNSAMGSSWLCGPSTSASGASPGQTPTVADVDVPSIYDNKPAPKGRRALKRERKAEKDKTLGKKWFGMKAPDVDEKLKNDMELIQMRSVLDPKRFYKHRDRKGLPKYFQMGTVVDEGTDFYSSRLTKKQRKQTLVEELMADANIRQYNKKKYAELQQKMRGKKTFKSKLKKH
ncbi:unnamed protein product [Candidula unifasciata]|uniref:Fcf2 pre-rRNA processing C-terminal domain-containing protein n=1 Tax=Candidula unifasciata TaxID=100452 RepID=A0A8S4A0I1_9EUPU|nr:unnamed protein product [Candidula unifasciata]